MGEDGSVTVEGVMLSGSAASELRLVERKPADVLAAAEHWLGAHEGGAITVVMRNPTFALATWTTGSASMALYWLATILGKVWVPSFKSERRPDPEPSAERPRATAQESGPVVLSGRNRVA